MFSCHDVAHRLRMLIEMALAHVVRYRAIANDSAPRISIQDLHVDEACPLNESPVPCPSVVGPSLAAWP